MNIFEIQLKYYFGIQAKFWNFQINLKGIIFEKKIIADYSTDKDSQRQEIFLCMSDVHQTETRGTIILDDSAMDQKNGFLSCHKYKKDRNEKLCI